MPQSQKKKDGGKIAGPANVPSVIEIRCGVQLPNGKTGNFVFHGHYTTAPPNMQTLAGALWTAISGAWGTNLAPHMAPATTFNNVSVRDMTSYTNPIYVGTGTAIPGTGAATAMPPQNAIVLTENVAQRGRGSKGRVYIGGWDTSADGGGGAISGVAQTAVNNFGTAVQNAISTNGLTPCVAQVARQQYQGITGTVHPARNATFVGVTSYICQDLRWDTQRRRGQL